MKLQKSKLLNKFKNITHAFSTSSGGISSGNFKTLNLAFHVNDDINLVQKNHQILADKLNYEKISLVYMNQIHSNIVKTLASDNNFQTPLTCDALITNKLKTPLMVMVADCAPILFYDAKKRVIAVAHSGRVGTFKNIVKNVIDSFKENYNSNTKDIFVSIGAKINICCYEVSHDIFTEAKELNLEYAIEERDKKIYLDIDKILYSQLIESGIKKENIDASNECTCCNSKYFSYRRDKITGRFAGVIVLD